MNKKVLIIVCSIIALVTSSTLVLMLANDKKVKNYNVSFETNGGTIINSQSVKEGEKVVKPNDPIKEGYVFIQWIYQKKSYDFSGPVKSNLVLTAEWIENKKGIETFTVKFNSNGGTIIPNQIIEKGNKVSIPAIPTRDGYNFVEWQYNGAKYDFKTPIKSDLELNASWKIVEEKNNKPSSNNNNKKSVNNNTSNNSTNNNTVNNNINNNNQKPSNNLESIEKPATESKLKTPLIIKAEAGVGLDDGTIVNFIILEEILGSVEIYFSTELNGKYELLKTQTEYDREETKWLNIEIPLGYKYYIKVRYVLNGKYSDFSNVLEFDNVN